MRNSKHELDMSQGPIFRKFIRFSIPIILSNVLQLLYHTADVAVVGRWTGSNAMAAVGASSSLITFITNLVIGISVGTNIAVSRRYGAQDGEGVFKTVHTAIMSSVILGFAVLILGQLLAIPYLKITNIPVGEVFVSAELYIRILFIGKPAELIYNFSAAILRAVGDTKRPLYILILSGMLNVILNLILVIGFDMGVSGVAVATVISNYLSMILVVVILVCTDGTYKLSLKKLKIYKKELTGIMKIGIPAGIQSSVLNLSNVLVQSAVNSFGTAAISGNTAAGNIESFTYAIKNSFSQATITAVSQNYGAKNEKRIKKSVRISLACVVTGCMVLGILMNVFARPLLGVYIVDSAEAIDFGVKRMFVSTALYFISGAMEILNGYVRGIGYSSLSTTNSLVGICGVRFIWVLLIFPLAGTFEMLYLCWPVSWVTVIILQLVSLAVVNKKAMKKMYED